MHFELGKVLKPQGIKGELKVLPLSKVEALKEAKKVLVGSTPAEIISCCVRDGYAYVCLDICRDRNKAEELRDMIIYLPEGEEIKLNDDEYLFADLIDCEVFTSQNEFVGKVVEVENYGATDIITIHKDLGNIACPFLRDVFLNIDVRAKKIIVDSKRFDEVTNYDED